MSGPLMQTFLPYSSYARSAAVLDDRRLGKQVVECRQIGRALIRRSAGWTRHPAVLMWDGHLGSLLLYAQAVADQWQHRDHDGMHRAWANTLLDHEQFIRDPARDMAPPPWLGDDRLHLSHRAALHRKAPDRYPAAWKQYATSHPDYFWPTRHPDYGV